MQVPLDSVDDEGVDDGERDDTEDPDSCQQDLVDKDGNRSRTPAVIDGAVVQSVAIPKKDKCVLGEGDEGSINLVLFRTQSVAIPKKDKVVLGEGDEGSINLVLFRTWGL